MTTYTLGGPFGGDAEEPDEVSYGFFSVQVSFIDETEEQLQKVLVDFEKVTEDMDGGIRRRWKATDSHGKVSYGKTRTEAVQKAVSRHPLIPA